MFSYAVSLLTRGKFLKTEAGKDIVQKSGVSTATIAESRLYNLVQDSVSVGEHTLELTAGAPGFRAYTLTFE